MKPAAFLLLLCLCPGFLQAQEQERKLIERLLEPDRTMKNTSFDRNFYGGSRFHPKSSKARSETFHFVDKVSARTFSARDFAASKSHWTGDFKFDARDARVAQRAARTVDREHRTGEFAVREAHDADRGVETKLPHDANRDFRGREADRMDKEIDPNADMPGWQGTLQPMTIDDVRELLNKNE